MTARDLYRLVARHGDRVLTAKGSSHRRQVLELLPRRPVVTIPGMVKMLETTTPTAAKSIELLEPLGILQETTGRKRGPHVPVPTVPRAAAGRDRTHSAGRADASVMRER